MPNVDLERWSRTWESAGEALAALRARELAAMTDDEARRAIADLFDGACLSEAPVRLTSGLVEQQRLFARLRK